MPRDDGEIVWTSVLQREGLPQHPQAPESRVVWEGTQFVHASGRRCPLNDCKSHRHCGDGSSQGLNDLDSYRPLNNRRSDKDRISQVEVTNIQDILDEVVGDREADNQIYTTRRPVVDTPREAHKGSHVPNNIDMPAHCFSRSWRRGVSGRRYPPRWCEENRKAGGWSWQEQ
jgi:hypothetical protein